MEKKTYLRVDNIAFDRIFSYQIKIYVSFKLRAINVICNLRGLESTDPGFFSRNKIVFNYYKTGTQQLF